MPLKLNVGLSRKVGESNYGSRGASVNVEMELESALVSEPVKLKERIRQLFDVVRSSVTEELNGNGHASGSGQPHNGSATTGNGNGANNATSNKQSSPRPATASQVKAINAIARSQRLDLTIILQNRFHVSRPEELSVRQASELIDTLKASSGNGG
jgi:hypothetical protein